MNCRNINNFIQKVSNAKNAHAKDVVISISDAVNMVLEFSNLITSSDSLITLEDIKELLKNNHEYNNNETVSKLSGGSS